MLITLQIDPKENPNIVGEALRALFFDQSKGTGCYETFDVRENVVELADHPLYFEDSDPEPIYILRHYSTILPNGETIQMYYYWDGDGTLAFGNSNFCVVSTDCKKDYEWESYNSIDKWLKEMDDCAKDE